MIRRNSRGVWAALAAACTLEFGGCHRAAPHHPNVLLILVDTLRADHLGAYGYPRSTSPTFDALAARGLLFTRAHSTTSWTNPAVESLFTGQFPRVLQPGAAQFITPDLPTLAEAFHAGGYRTGAIVANPVLPPDLGFARGFDDYLPVSGWVYGLAQRPKEPAERVNAAAQAWLQRPVPGMQRPWFLYLHYMDPHWPYEPPVDELQRFWRSQNTQADATIAALNVKVRKRQETLLPAEAEQLGDVYDAAVAHFDAHLRRLLDFLHATSQQDDTLVCIVADHGEELGDHGGVQHARTLYEEVLHIPLLLVPPGGQDAARDDRVVQITDVGRTLLDLAGLHDSVLPGRSLARGHQAAGADEALMAELMPGFLLGTQHQYALLRGTAKLVTTPAQEDLLFDLVRDPGEHQNLISERPHLLAELKHLLQQSIVRRQPQPVGTPDPALRERMRALGYDF